MTQGAAAQLEAVHAALASIGDDAIARQLSRFDIDQDGELDAKELAKLLKRILGTKPRKRDLRALFQALDMDGSGQISIRELREFASSSGAGGNSNSNSKSTNLTVVVPAPHTHRGRGGGKGREKSGGRLHRSIYDALSVSVWLEQS